MSMPIVTFGDICEFKYGKALSARVRKDGEVAVYGSNGQVGTHDVALSTGPSIIVGRKGSVGEVHYCDGPNWAIDTTYYIDHSATECHLKWLAYALSASRIRTLNKAAAVPGLNRNDAYIEPVMLPPLEEQKRIAAILDKADQLRQKRRQAIALLDSLTQSIFLEMFGDLRINPHGYPIVAVGDVTGCIVPGRDKPKSFTGTVPWITTGELNSMGYTSSTNAKQSLSQDEISEVRARVIPRESVILTCVGDLGVVSIANEPMVINQQLHSYQCMANIEPEFLMHALTFAKEYMFARATKTTLPYMNKSVCNSIPIPLPPIESQKRFRSLLRETKARSEAMFNASIHADALFSSLQIRAFTGQL